MTAIAISLSDFNLLDKIDEGGAGAVWKVAAKRELQFAKTGGLLALKIYNDTILAEPAQWSRFKKRSSKQGLACHTPISCACIISM